MAEHGASSETEPVDVVVRLEGRETGTADGACPRCGESLSEYVLSERATVACDDCGFLGASADHTASSVERESWESALERFREERS